MTRTARSSSLRAILKDRSESKSGYDKSIRKNGAGPHNWGDLAHEVDFEFAAMDDERLEHDEGMSSQVTGNKTRIQRRASVDEVEDAKRFRQIALKGEGMVDLTTIARTSSAVSGSPIHESITVIPDAGPVQ